MTQQVASFFMKIVYIIFEQFHILREDDREDDCIEWRRLELWKKKT